MAEQEALDHMSLNARSGVDRGRSPLFDAGMLTKT